jgi:hypothetical protein
MNFAVRLIDLKRQPFLWVPAEPKEIVLGGKRYQTLLCLDLIEDAIRVELRPVEKEKKYG